MTRTFLLATLFAGALIGPAAAEDQGGMSGMAGMAGADASAQAGSILPRACLAASEDRAMAPTPAEAGLDSVQKANREAMVVMDGPMMRAATIHDADLAFNCAMIAHHAGAIAMARVELSMGKDAASKALAGEIIAAQEKEIAAMTAWIESRPN